MKLDDPRVSEVIPLAFEPREVEWVESRFESLSADQRPEFLGLFESIDTVREMHLSAAAAGGLEKEFRCASAWHAARGRPELSEKYARLAGVLREVFKEKLN